MGQLDNFIAINEKGPLEDAKDEVWEWMQESVGPCAKILNKVDVHWPERGDGLVQTAMPIACVPMGRLFEISVLKIMTMVRRGSGDLGVRIGISRLAPNVDEIQELHYRNTLLQT